MITHTEISATPLGDRYYRVNRRILINYKNYLWTIGTGFITNFRSGPHVDRFLDQIGTDLIQCCYLVHDVNYTPGILGYKFTRPQADGLLRAMLIDAGMSHGKAYLVWAAVRLFGQSAYTDDDKYTKDNSTKFKIEKIA